MSATLQFDEDASRRVERIYTTLDVIEQRQTILRALALKPEYVDDVPAALLELGRVLRPGGRALVLDTDWDSIVWASSDNERMDRVLAAWEEHLVDPHLPRTLTRLLGDAGLEVTDRQIVPLFNAGHDPNTYSAGMLELIATFVTDRNGVSEAEATAWAQDWSAPAFVDT
jgi:arsenite methyltransferase